jgi:hypothetical protein
MRGSARGKGRPPLHSRRLLVPMTAVSPAACNPGGRIAGGMRTQSRQSAKLFSSRRNWDFSNPSPAGLCTPAWHKLYICTLYMRGSHDITIYNSAKMRKFIIIEQLFAKNVQIKSLRSYQKLSSNRLNLEFFYLLCH